MVKNVLNEMTGDLDGFDNKAYQEDLSIITEGEQNIKDRISQNETDISSLGTDLVSTNTNINNLGLRVTNLESAGAYSGSVLVGDGSSGTRNLNFNNGILTSVT